jgi:hypothetical protein
VNLNNMFGKVMCLDNSAKAFEFVEKILINGSVAMLRKEGFLFEGKDGSF